MADNPLHLQTWKSATIANGASLSGAINVQGWDVVAIEQPAACEGTAFTFQISMDGLTFVDVYDSAGAELSVTKSATLAQTLLLGTKEIRGAVFLKVRSGATGLPVVQAGDAVLKVALRKVA